MNDTYKELKQIEIINLEAFSKEEMQEKINNKMYGDLKLEIPNLDIIDQDRKHSEEEKFEIRRWLTECLGKFTNWTI